MKWILLGVYVVGYLPAALIITGFAAEDVAPDDVADYAMAGLLGFITALLWPLILAGFVVGHAFAAIAKAVAR